MSNKLKKIFSNHTPEYGFEISFKDDKSEENFYKALENVWENGKPIEIDGIEKIMPSITDGNNKYPLTESKYITKFTVYPSKKNVPLKIKSKDEEKEIRFISYQTKKEIIFETKEKEIIYIKFAFVRETENIKFTYKFQPQYAEKIQEIADSIYDLIGIFNRLFKIDGDKLNPDVDKIIDILISFKKMSHFFDLLCAIERRLNLSFEPEKIGDIGVAAEDVEELYLLLIEKKPLKLNAKLTPTEATGITIDSKVNEPQIGDKISLTFLNKATCSVCGQDILIYTANLLENAVIKEIIENRETGKTKMLYDEADNNPMFISYTGFATEEDAKQELGKIMENKDKYISALTLQEHRKKYLESIYN